jgi:NHL repeat
MTTPSPLRLALAALCLLASLLASAGVASAAEEEERDVLLSSLPGPEAPSGLAWDAANGTVIATNGHGQRPTEVSFFPAGGGPAVASLPAGAPPGTFDFSQVYPAGVAVDRSGDVYVADAEDGLVDRFEPLGAAASDGYKYVCQLSGVGDGCVETAGPSSFGQIAEVAVDSSGDVYVAAPQTGAVDEFDSAGDDVAQFLASDHPAITAPPVAVAVDNQGDMFILDEARQVIELERGEHGELVGEATLPTNTPVSAISFDRASGVLLVSENGVIRGYDPATKTFTGFQVNTSPWEDQYFFSSVAIQETPGLMTGDVYSDEVEIAKDDIYGTPPPLPPGVSGEAVAEVTVSSAKLSATVEPKLRGTHYQFQYGSDESYGSGALPPAPGGFVAGQQASSLVSVSLTGLTAGATYHYRIAASNKEGTTYGPDQTFTTYGPLEAGLPDGRVWEMVSPLDKNAGHIESFGAEQASANGEKIAYVSAGAFAAPQGNSLANQYIGSRASDGWTTENISPKEESGTFFNAVPVQAFSGDLSHALVRNDSPMDQLHEKLIVNPPIEGTDAPPGYVNAYVRDNVTGTFRALLTTIPAFASGRYGMSVEAVTPDFDHAVYRGYDHFSHPAGAPDELVEWSAGIAAPVNIGLHGEVVEGAVIGSGDAEGSDDPHALSNDGSRVFWSVGGDALQGLGSEPVFVRENPSATESPVNAEGDCVVSTDACTVQLPPGEFVDASAQTGSKVLLSTGELFDLEKGVHGEQLADLTEGDGGFVGELGASTDLSKIYFVDTAVLPGASSNSFGAVPRLGGNNLYLYREGAVPAFIATLSPGLGGVSPDKADGATLLFQSGASLTGYDNIAPDACPPTATNPDGRCLEIYLYRANTGALVCVSCNPTGAVPTGVAELPPGNAVERAEAPRRGARVYYQPRNLSANGERVFFDTDEALVAQDRNGASDVYEWEGGHVHLVSSGTGGGAQFVDASESGDDVFFSTGNELVPGDTDELTDLYDARVDGGFPAPTQAPLCTGGGCQGAPAPAPLFATPSSLTAAGVGNFPDGLTPPAAKKTAAQLRAAKLAAALKKCKKDRSRSKRATCEKTAHRKYGAKTAKRASIKKRGK